MPRFGAIGEQATENFGEVLLLRAGRCWAVEDWLRVRKLRVLGGSTDPPSERRQGRGISFILLDKNRLSSTMEMFKR